MGNTYTRQTSPAPSTGDTIQVTHLNAEFTALVNAFDASSGHSHDGTTGEGGPVIDQSNGALKQVKILTKTDIPEVKLVVDKNNHFTLSR